MDSKQVVGYVDSEEKLNELLEHVKVAQEAFNTLTQEQVDKIFDAAALAAVQNRVVLAKDAVEEAGMGIFEDKTIKNHFAAESVHNAYKNEKTCGVISRDDNTGHSISAEPIGVLAGIIPCTNPTSTTIFKALLALKSRNCIVFSPHPRTGKCTIKAAQIVRDAAVAAGAPANCIGWIDKPAVSLCNNLMQHNAVSMILATGAGGLVKAAYSSGKPCMGGGAGNTPVIIDETADIEQAANGVLLSKSFDNGMICASEQAIVVVDSVADKVKEEFIKRGAFFVEGSEEKARLGDAILLDNGALNPPAVGQSPAKLAELANISGCPANAKMLMVELASVGAEEKLSHEKLCPCLGFYRVPDFDTAIQRALQLVQYGGMGHTSVLYTDLNGIDKTIRVEKFESTMLTGRTLLCMPTSQGAIGDIYNARLKPSLSLGCGSWGGNASSEGLQLKHLLNYKHICTRLEKPLSVMPNNVSFGKGNLCSRLSSCVADTDRVFILCSAENQQFVEIACFGYFKERGLPVQSYALAEFYQQKPRISDIKNAAKKLRAFAGTTIVAVGSEPVLNGAKALRLYFEAPDTNLELITTRFFDMSKKIMKFPSLSGTVRQLITVPTMYGSGAEVTPFATVYDDSVHKSYFLVDSELLPQSTIVDYNLFDFAASQETRASAGMNTLVTSLETVVSMMTSEITESLGSKATQMIFQHLANAVKTNSPLANAVCQRASVMAGMAATNAFVGLSSAMSRQLSEKLGLPDGIGKALVARQVIWYNCAEAPSKMGTFPQYEKPQALNGYAGLSLFCGLSSFSESVDAKIDSLIKGITRLMENVGVPLSVRDCGTTDEVFRGVCQRMSYDCFDDQACGVNPRYPLVAELQQLFYSVYDTEKKWIR